MKLIILGFLLSERKTFLFFVIVDVERKFDLTRISYEFNRERLTVGKEKQNRGYIYYIDNPIYISIRR
jgi:hypothetical protein